jgi:large subunit ribosomal protein L9
MATTEALLSKCVKTVGPEGDQIKVKAGYARNFLLPKRFAIPVARTNHKQIEALQRAKKSLAIVVKTGENGKMFEAVTAK